MLTIHERRISYLRQQIAIEEGFVADQQRYNFQDVEAYMQSGIGTDREMFLRDRMAHRTGTIKASKAAILRMKKELAILESSSQ